MVVAGGCSGLPRSGSCGEWVMGNGEWIMDNG
jgi:hypothetical protein